jgi:capsular polysaccharide biosynthesis protein
MRAHATSSGKRIPGTRRSTAGLDDRRVQLRRDYALAGRKSARARVASAAMTRFAAGIWRRAWIVALATAGAALAAHVAVADYPRVHEAKAVLLVGPLKAGIDTLRASGPLAETYAELGRSRPVLDATDRRLHERGAARSITMSANQTTRLLTVEARDADAARAARIANAHAATLVALAARRASGAIPSGRLQLVDPAVPSRSAVGPDATTLTILAGLLGFGIALALVALAERSRTTIRDGSELEAVAGVPCLASVGRAALRRRRTPVVEHAPHSRAADEYRLLAAKLDALGARSLAVVSVNGAQGSLIAANLVGALRARGARVAVVDPDDTAGGEEPRRSDLGSEGAGALLARLLAESDVVVLHPAGGAGSSTGLAWARVAEATLLAVQRQRTPRHDVTSAVQSLRLVQARLAGAVLTAPSRRS